MYTRLSSQQTCDRDCGKENIIISITYVIYCVIEWLQDYKERRLTCSQGPVIMAYLQNTTSRRKAFTPGEKDLCSIIATIATGSTNPTGSRYSHCSDPSQQT